MSSQFNSIHSLIRVHLKPFASCIYLLHKYLRELKALCRLRNRFIASSGRERRPRGLEENRVRGMDGDTFLCEERKKPIEKYNPNEMSVLVVMACFKELSKTSSGVLEKSGIYSASDPQGISSDRFKLT